MCGRYSLFAPPEDIADLLGVRVDAYEPRYNAAPGQPLPVVTDTDADSLSRLEWGLVPPWADERDGHINARSETLDERPTFRDAFRQERGTLAAGRCLVPADGFYEWVDRDGTTRPYRVTMADERPFAMAGLWSQWRPETTQTGLDAFGDGGGDAPEPEVLTTFAIVTTEPNALVTDLHHRMAAILPPEEAHRWLSAPPETARELLRPYPADEMRAYRVSKAVNDPANDAPEIVEPLDSGA